ncbi:MAG: hypothetical protein FWD61_00400 [Phycisphaerales bacterium]|nr:hypothetical protein [Phycisphaerales bacterium]
MSDTALRTIVEPITEAAAQSVQTIIDQVTTKLGKTQAATLAPVIAQYGPAFVAMTAADIWAWIELATRGDPYESYAAIVRRLPNQELANEWAAINQKMQTANVQNAAAVAWQRDAIGALLKALVAIAATLVFV